VGKSSSFSPTKFQKHNSAISQYGDMSPPSRHTQILEFMQPEKRRSARSFEKEKTLQAIEKGRAPRMPFVSGMRHGMRRGTSLTKPFRNNSPPDKIARRDTGIQPTVESSADEVASKSPSSNHQLSPQDIIKKYKGSKINSLKPSVYKDMTIRIYQTINLIK